MSNNNRPRLDGKVFVVTGATKGIGTSIAERIVCEGGRVVITGRDSQAGTRLVDAIGADSCFFVNADITTVEGCSRGIMAATERFGRLDGLVNNAGIFPRASLLETDEDLLDTVLAVDLKGAFHSCRFAIPVMAEMGGGSIVNVGSTHAWGGSKRLAAYAVSKGALWTLTQHIAMNYASDRIRANWVTVGWVETPGETSRLAQEGRDEAWLRSEGARRVPLGRLQSGDDIAYAVVYLLADESAQVTGTAIHVTGGFLP